MNTGVASVDAEEPTNAKDPLMARSLRPEWVKTFGRALKLGRTRVGAAIFLFMLAVIILGPFVPGPSPDNFVGAPYQLPGAGFPLGTDALGRDVLARTLNGGMSVLLLAVTATAIGVSLGALLGVASGMARPVVDSVVMRILDVFLAFPQLVFVLLLVSVFGTQLWLVILAVAITHAPRVARIARGATLEIKEQDYILNCEILGVSRWRIAVGEIIPAITGPLLVEAGLSLTWSVSLVASVGFLGLGIQPPAVDWGLMINENRIGIAIQPFAVFVPVCMVALLAVGVNLMTDGLSRAIVFGERGHKA